ncbi:MAG: hypothetical protein QXG39_04150 [Candidatus Aenigmatarchaeota archaeon]
MKCEFQSLQELMEYIEEEAQKRVEKFLKGEIERNKFKFKLSAPGEYVVSIQTYILQIIKISC